MQPAVIKTSLTHTLRDIRTLSSNGLENRIFFTAKGTIFELHNLATRGMAIERMENSAEMLRKFLDFEADWTQS